MPKYIDAEVLKNNIHRCTWVHDMKCVEKFVDSLPTADVQEVRHGKWVMNERGVYECSVCGRVPTEEQKQYDQYCPNCGAKMEGEEE